jgi:colicin import membrane protein
MENRPLSLVAGLIALLVMPLAALAAENEADAARQAAWNERLSAAAAMQAESKVKQGAAKQLLEQKNLDCTHRFLVNACRDEAYRGYLKSVRENRRLENDGKALEREVKKEQAAERQKRVAEAAPERAAERQEREVETAEARRASEEKAETTRAGKVQKSAEGVRHKAVEAEKLQRKQAAHEARVAEKKKQAERHAEREVERRAEHEAAKAAANR